VEIMTIGAVVAAAIVVIVFFMAGVGFGVFWILARSFCVERKPGPYEDYDEPDPGPG
jgi:hypothetical protein